MRKFIVIFGEDRNAKTEEFEIFTEAQKQAKEYTKTKRHAIVDIILVDTFINMKYFITRIWK